MEQNPKHGMLSTPSNVRMLPYQHQQDVPTANHGLQSPPPVVTTTDKTKIIQQPTPDCPWSIDIINEIPTTTTTTAATFVPNDDDTTTRWSSNDDSTARAAASTLGTKSNICSGRIIVGCSTPPWYCVVTKESRVDEMVGLQPYQITVWYSSNSSNHHAWKPNVGSPSQHHPRMHPTPDSHVVCFTLDHGHTVQGVPPFVAMLVSASSSTKHDVCYIYVMHPMTGTLLLYKISQQNMIQKNIAAAASNNQKSLLRWIKPSESLVLGNAEERVVTAFRVEWNNIEQTTPLILMGCSDGTAYYVVQTHIPISLRCIPVVPQHHHHHRNNRTPSGMFSRLWSTIQYHEPNTTIAAIVGIGTITNYCATTRETTIGGAHFATVTDIGTVQLWYTRSPVANSSQQGALFDIRQQVSLLDLLREFSNATSSSMHHLQVLAVTACNNTTDNNCSTLHCVVLTHDQSGEESRLYWMVLSISGLATVVSSNCTIHVVSNIWINRFVDPTSVTIPDIGVASNGIVYLLVRPDDDTNNMPPTIVMASDGQRIVSEIDLPANYEILSHSASPDTVTNGISVLDTFGIHIRIRWVLPHPNDTAVDTTSVSVQPAHVATLATHLHSVFRSYYLNPTNTEDRMVDHIRLPPSILKATKADLEAAAHLSAYHLFLAASNSRTAIDTSIYGTTNALDVHIAFITMLQISGMYRNFSTTCKWMLMTMGQRVNVWLALEGLRSSPTESSMSEWGSRCWDQLSGSQLENWMVDVQASVLMNDCGDDRRQLWVSWLVRVLSAAATFREERAAVLYDVSSNAPPLVSNWDDVPVWTSLPSVQNVLHELLLYWTNDSAAGASFDNIEYVVQLYLLSCSDSFASFPCKETRARYVSAQQLSFATIRKTRKDMAGDEFIFEVSIAHRFFSGICQLAHEHERRRDRNTYSLDSLFQRLALQEDVETGMLFGLYVLRWHSDRGYIGHVLRYGKLCPQELSQLINNDATLRPFRWIHAVRQGDYNGATESLYGLSQLPFTSIKDVKNSLCIASMTSFIVVKELPTGTLRESAINRQELIEKKLTLVDVQKDLLGEDEGNDDTARLRTSDHLLDIAIFQAEQHSNLQDKISKFTAGLAVCTTFESDNRVHDAAMLLWFKAILIDADFWDDCVRGQHDLTSSRLCGLVSAKTVFGALVQQTKGVQHWKAVAFEMIEEDLCVQMGELYPLLREAGMQRLLHSVATMPDRRSSDAM